MVNKIVKSIKNHDIFGTPVSLNFNQDGTNYKTLIGGLFSLLIKVVMILFFIHKFYLLVSLGDN